MRSGITTRLAGWFDRLLTTSAFPRADHGRRIRASFVLALAVLQSVGSGLFALTEWRVGHWTVAGLLTIGTLLPFWPGLRMRRDGNVDRWSQVFIANMFLLLGGILIASGGRSIGVVMALPALLLVSSLVSNGRQLLGWGGLVIAILLLGNHLRGLPGPWPIAIDPLWAQSAIGRVPVILAACLLGTSALLRLLLDRVFADLAAARANETQAITLAQFEQQRFADFADIAADWFWETDAALRLIYVSPGITAHTGLFPEQVLGLEPATVVRQWQLDTPELREIEARMALSETFVAPRMAWRDMSGQLSIFRNVGRPRTDVQGRFLGYRGAVTNITETWRLTRELERQARTDPLTGLLNRRAFSELLGVAISEVRAGAAGWWLLQLDLDHFKAVNDQAGHAVGDQLLLRTAAVLREGGLPATMLARMGGDEFCALLPTSDAAQIDHCAQQVLDGMRALRPEFTEPIGASIGIVAITGDDESRQLQAVDEACYRAKRAGRDRIARG